jgi:hypothetical protein
MMEGPNPGKVPVMPIYEGDLVSVGLTKREYFAAIALQGLLANGEFSSSMDSDDEEFNSKAVTWYAKRAVRCADLLIAELNRMQGGSDEQS